MNCGIWYQQLRDLLRPNVISHRSDNSDETYERSNALQTYRLCRTGPRQPNTYVVVLIMLTVLMYALIYIVGEISVLITTVRNISEEPTCKANDNNNNHNKPTMTRKV